MMDKTFTGMPAIHRIIKIADPWIEVSHRVAKKCGKSQANVQLKECISFGMLTVFSAIKKPPVQRGCGEIFEMAEVGQEKPG
ncbi:MAG TPA: hypothetical protein PKO04_00865 [Smithellaceae bacterium]|nr:hypothetical protein [Smithellaceae bacterium]HPV71626.1 hypothetical protein [Smithellaceae bacterium]HQK89753.1 hypothetical protein [Smithellaceae bacterium]